MSIAGVGQETKKAPRLPPPPLRSILKANPHYVYESKTPKDASTPRSTLMPHAGSTKKKSIVEMSDEELMALDSQYRKGVSLENLKFDGDGYLPLHDLTIIEAKKMSNTKNIDKFVGTMVNNRKVLRPSISNYHSYSTSYTHTGLSLYIQEFLNKGKTKNNEDAPSSLRELALYVSGRRHTWSALDWTIKNFLRDGDHLVVLSQVPDKVAVDPENYQYRNDDNEKVNDDNDDSDEPLSYEYVDVEEYYGTEGIKNEAHRLSAYIFKALQKVGKKDLKISFTVELIKEKNVASLLRNAITLYSPHVFLVSSLATKYSSAGTNLRLPFYVLNKLSVPSVLIPHQLISDDVVELKPLDEDSLEGDSMGEESLDELDPLKRLNRALDALDKGVCTEVDGEVTETSRSRYLFNPYNDSHPGTGTTSSRVTTTDDEAETPMDYLGLQPQKIKFSDKLQTPSRYSSTYSGNNSRRNSHSSGIYKVKSLLDTESTPVERSKTYSSPMTNSISNTSSSSMRRNGNGSSGSLVKKVSSEPSVEKKKGFFGFLKRKK
jgi:hypothetical protein